MKNIALNHDCIRKYIKPYSKYWAAYCTIVGLYYYAPKHTNWHCHHIVPKCLLKAESGLCVIPEDDVYNTCFVPLDVHITLHSLLYLAAKKGWFKESMKWAVEALCVL